MDEYAYNALNDAAEKIRSKALRLAVLDVIESGRVNADDTVRDGDASPDDRGWLFLGSIQTQLAFCENARARAWFAARGINF